MKRTLIAAVIILLLVPALAMAQAETTGRITGVVQDPVGAVIPGATVKATHLGTGRVYEVTTNAAGRFVIPSVRLGRYDVTVEAPSFRRAVITGVHVEVGQAAALTVNLQLGAVTEEVVVTADAAQQIINTVDAELSTVVDERRVLELPLNGRNATELTLLQAGVFYETTPEGQGNKLIVHGQRHSSLSITLDGLDTQDNFNRASSIMINQPLIALSAENVQEFKVATGNTSAEYSRGGSHVSAVTRSGSNEWHGSLFWFHRNDKFSAGEFFQNRAGQERSKLIRNQFGGRIGGPIVKDKTFFFFGYQQTREARGIPQVRTVWSEDARNGIFRFLEGIPTTVTNVANNPGLIREIDLLRCDPAADPDPDECLDDRFEVTDGITALDPAFGYDRITIDPLVQTVIAAMPLPNDFSIGDGLNTHGFRFSPTTHTFEHLPAFRLDHAFTPNHNFYATFNYTDRNIEGDFVNSREQIWPSLGVLGFRTTLSKAFGLGLASTFTPTMVNELRAGVTAGENAFPRNQPFNTPFTLDFDDITDPYNPGGASGTARDNETWHLRDTVSWVKGNHQFKFGGEFRHRYAHNRNFLGTEAWGEIDFNDSDFRPGWRESNIESLLGIPSSVDSMTSGEVNDAEELNNNLIGAMGDVEIRYNVTDISSGFGPVGTGEIRAWEAEEFDFFFNDTWQISPRFTLTMGLRWEHMTIPDEVDGLILLPQGGQDAIYGVSGLEGFFNPGVLAGPPCSFLSGVPIAAPTRDDVENLILDCGPRMDLAGGKNGIELWDADYNNFGPVLSLAWDPWGDGKSAIRAGYRISYYQDHFAMVEDHLDDNEGLRALPICEPSDPSIACQNVDPDDDVAALLRNLTGPPLPPVPAFSLPSGPPLTTFLNSTSSDFRTYLRDLETPYYQEWNFGVSREFWGHTAFEVRYVGNRGLKLRRNYDANNINVNAFDPVTGMTFLEAFEIAQDNLGCNRAVGDGDDYSDRGNAGDPLCAAFPLAGANPLMNDLIAADESDLDGRGDLVDALDLNETGDFVWHLLHDESSETEGGGGNIRGGAFFSAVLEGRFPINFFMANPFVASSRRMGNDSFSTYHAMEIEVRRRLAQGLMFQANYTFGKALSDYDGDQNVLENDRHPSSSRNGRYTTEQIMPRHQFNANWVWELPIGSGRAFEPTSTAARKLLGSWQLGGIVRMRSGRPFSILSGFGSHMRAGISDDNRVSLGQAMSNDQLRDLAGRRDIAGGLYWFDPNLSRLFVAANCFESDPAGDAALFQCPSPGELGNIPGTTFYGPSRFTLDFNLSKRTQITETVDLEFRWEVFNATNTPNFNLPGTNFTADGFGRISSTTTSPRVMQFALKINF